VWLIYAADRTLDAWRGADYSPRHEFYRRHWRSLLPAWTAILGLTAWLAADRLPPGLFLHGSMLIAAVGVYLALVHSSVLRLHKEAAVGVLFALGASLVAWGKVKTPADVTTILLFSGLCWMNCIAIQKWEIEKLDWSPSIAAIVVACAAGVLLYAHRPVLGGAELASAFGFLLLDRMRRRLSADTVRVLADVALLSPVFFLPMVRG
jgi:drug/metabolite transporter (DMT)-like permease